MPISFWMEQDQYIVYEKLQSTRIRISIKEKIIKQYEK